MKKYFWLSPFLLGYFAYTLALFSRDPIGITLGILGIVLESAGLFLAIYRRKKI